MTHRRYSLLWSLLFGLAGAAPAALGQTPAIVDDLGFSLKIEATTLQHRGSGRGLSASDLLALVTQPTRVHTLVGSDSYGPSVEWTPDGNSVLAALPRNDGTGLAYGIFLIDLRTGEQSFLADGARARMSPNGAWIAFVDGRNQLAVARFDANQHSRLQLIADSVAEALMPTAGVADFTWSPDSRTLVFAVRDGRNGELDTITRTIVGTYDVRTGERRVVYQCDGVATALAWVTGREFFLAREMHRVTGLHPQAWANISSVDPISGVSSVRIQDSGADARALAPGVSPDGHKLAFGRDANVIPAPVGGYSVPAVYDLVTGVTRAFTLARNYALTYAPPYMPPQWRPGSREFVYLCKTGALFSSLCIVGARSGRLRRLDLDPARDIARFAVDPVYGRLAILSEDTVGSIRLTILDPHGRHARDVYQINRFSLDRVSFGRVTTFTWSTRDDLKFTGLLILPVGYRANRRYPVVVDIHGGPNRGIRLDGALLSGLPPLEWQLWAAKGYAVFVADYRKGGVAGLKPGYFRRTRGYLEDEDVADVSAGIHALISRGIADPERIVAVGHSYGGNVLNWWIATGRTPFRAVVVHEAPPNLYWEAQETSEQPGAPFLGFERWYLNADETHRREIAIENSPMTYASRTKTPVLLMAGNADGRQLSRKGQPRDQMVEYRDAINAHGGCAKLLEFPNEGHVFLRPENLQRVLSDALSWFAYWDGTIPPSCEGLRLPVNSEPSDPAYDNRHKPGANSAAG